MGGSTSSDYSKRGTTTETGSTTPTGLEPYTTPFGQGYKDIYQQYQNLQNTPLGLKEAPIYSTGLDPVVQNTISKGIQNIKAQQNTRGQQTANVLNTAGTGNNAALLNILNRQSALSGAAAGNQLRATGIEQQRMQDIARQSMISGINRDKLAGRQTQIQQLGQGTNLLQTLIQMGQVARGDKRAGSRTISESGTESTNKSFI